ncbi:MAG: sporulation integral membrane protein YtvI [Clostridia bacterium]|nr:sporulation integral membrane protein YtvI [Clostridia bacterium]
MEEKTNYYWKMLSKFLIFVIILIGIYVLYKTTIFYMPFIIALIIASIAEPLIKLFMKKLKWGRKLASTVSLILIVSVIVILISILISSIITESINLVENLNGYIANAYDYGVGLLSDIQEGRIEISEEVMQIAEKSYGTLLEGTKTVIGNFFTGVINTISAIPEWFTYGFITILAVVFICFDREYMIETCKKHIPQKWLKTVKSYGKTTFSVVVDYIKAEAKLSCICFVLVLVGLTTMNMCGIPIEYPIIMAIFIGFVDILPIFGAGTVMIPWTIYLVIVGNIPSAIGVGVLWLIWAIIKNLVEPKMISQQMGLHPIFTLLAMYTGFKFFGVLGLMIGPIILIILKNIFAEIIDKGVLKTIFEQE